MRRSTVFVGLLAGFIALQLACVSCVSNRVSPRNVLSMSLEDLMNVRVTTASKYQEDIRDSPANMTIFTREQIKQRGYRHIGDILKALPGVDVVDFALLTNPTTASFRGHAENNKFLILQDGVRISAAGGETTNVAHNFPIYYAKQIEVLMGPAAVVYGADAFMGVINIISMDQNDENFARTEFSMGTDNYRYGEIHIHQALGYGLHLSLGAQKFKSQEYDFASDFPEIYPPGGSSPTGMPFEFPQDRAEGVFFKLRTEEHWEFGINHSSNINSTHIGSLPTVSAFDHGALENEILTTSYIKHSTDIDSDIRSTTLASYQIYETDNATNFNNVFTNYTPQYKYAHTDRFSLNQDFTWRVNDEHFVSAGVVYDKFDTVPIGADLPSPYDETKGPQEQGMLYPGTTLPLVFLDYRHENYGVYVQDNWKLDEEWRLVGGLRYDHDTFYGDNLSPRLSAIYQPDDSNIVKLLYGHSYLAPSPDLAYRNFGGFTGFNSGTGLWESGFFHAPNLGLKPEELRSVEVVYEHWFDENSYLKVAPFYTRIKNAIASSGDSTPNQFIPGAQIFFTQSFKNINELEIFGIDIGVEAKHDIESFNIRSWGAVSYIDGSTEAAGAVSDLPLVAHYKFKGGASATYDQRFTISPQVFWVGTMNGLHLDPGNSSRRIKSSGYFLVNLHAEAKFAENFSFVAGVHNLLDEKYTNGMVQDPGLAPRTAPQPGRIITFGFVSKF